MSEGFSIIIPSWNGRALLEQHLPSVEQAVARLRVTSEIIIVDDASTDGTEAFLRERHPSVRVVRRAQNGGFHAAITSGIDTARHDILYLLNTDVQVDPEAFDRVLPHFADARVFAVASRDTERVPFGIPSLTNRAGLLGVRYVCVPESSDPLPILFATGGHSAYRAEAFRQLRGFDELFAPCYWEDIDLGVRAHAEGWRMLLEPRSRVRHWVGSSISRKYPRHRVEGFRAAHRWLFRLRHSSSVGPAAWGVLAAAHGSAALTAWPAALRRRRLIKPQAERSQAVLRRFSVSAVKRAAGAPWTIAYVSPTGRMTGGGEVSLLTLLAGLDRTRVRPVLLAPTSGGLTQRAQANDVEVALMRIPPTVLGLLDGTVGRLIQWLRANDVDAIHVNAPGRSLLLPGLAAKLLGLPVIWHVRVASPQPVVDRLTLSLCTRVIVTSAYVRSRFPSEAARQKVTQIPNPVDTEAFRLGIDGRAWRAQYQIPAEATVIGMIGRLDRWKRFDLGLRAFALARAQEPTLWLAVIGDGPQRRALVQLAQRLGFESAVSFVGWQEPPAIAMAALDLVLHPTPTEHFGRIFIEAMACGKPVVAPRSGGAVELVVDQQTGRLVEPCTPEALAEGLLELIRRPQRRAEMGRVARERAERLFGIPAIAASVLAVYEALLAGDGDQAAAPAGSPATHA